MPLFICANCDIEVPDLQYVWAKFFSFNRGRGWRYPVCPNGHPLRSLVIGNMKPSSFAFGLWRGFGVSLLIIFLMVCRSVRLHNAPRLPQLLVLICAALLTIYGLIALAWAWSWAERKGPVGRLTARSAGVAFGHLIPAVVLWFALAVGWVDSLAAWNPSREY